MLRRSSLKRTTGLKPGDSLKPDPEKVREFQARGRQPGRAFPDSQIRGAEGGRRKQRTEQDKAKGVAGVASMNRVGFRAPKPPWPDWCVRCLNHGRIVRATTWHHWTGQQHIRTYIRGLRLPEAEARRLTSKLLADRRNLSRLCDDCHGHRTIQHAMNLTADDVPDSAHAFAADLGPEWVERLRRSYPNKPQTGV